MRTRDVCNFIIRRSKFLRRKRWSAILCCPPHPYLLFPVSLLLSVPPAFPSPACKSMSSRAKFAFGDGWPLVIAFQINITAPIAHTIFLLYLSFRCFPHQNSIGFCYFFFPFHSYLLAVITQDSVCSISKDRERHYSLFWKLDVLGTDFI